MRYALSGTIFFLALIFGITWAVQGNDFFLYKVFAPKYEAARRQTFEESKAYNEGMAQELAAAELDYAKANAEQKAAIRSVLIQRYAGYDTTRLPPDLRQFLDTLKGDSR
jgi:hypothetical protein